MAEVDPVILELIARNDRYLAELRNTTRVADQQLGAQERRVKRLEAQMRSSTSSIAMSLRGLAGTLAAYFTGRELIGLIDGFTRLQNELRVAGLEGTALETVQARLFEIANKNGVAINSLAELYGKSASAARDFGASQEQMLGLTEASALALRISGTNAQSASGALLGLSQALASGTVRAEEFNQMNEGGLRPLLQAAAASDEFGGSIGKLRKAVIEGELSSRDFFGAILAGSEQLRGQANNAVLTLSGSFEVLRNKLIEYVGGSASANGATGALARGIALLADNLDTLLEALAVIATVMVGRYVAGMVAGGVATRALAAHLSIATTSLAGTALAARSAGAALLGAFGGPVGLAVTALALGIGYLATETAAASAESARLAEVSRRNANEFLGEAQAANAATRETEGLSDAQIIARSAALGLALDTDKLANSHYRAAAAARVQAIEEQKLAAGSAARAANREAQRIKSRTPFIRGKARAAIERETGDPFFTAAEGQEFLNSPEYRAYVQARDTLKAMINEPVERFAPETGGGRVETVDGDKPTKPDRPTAPTGPTEAEIAQRHAQELARINQEELQARAQLTDNAEERADLEREMLIAEFNERAEQIKNDENFTAEQKRAQIAALERLYGVAADGSILVSPNSPYQQQVSRDETRQLEQEARDLAEELNRATLDELSLQYELARTEADRRAIALKILEAEDAALRTKLEAVRDSKVAGEAEKERARIALEALDAQAGMRREGVERQHQGALGRYLDSTSDPAAAAEEAAVREIQAVRDGLVEGLTDNLGIKNQFVKDMLTIFLDQVLFRPLAEALRTQAGGGGIGGLITSLLGTVAGAVGGGGATVGSHSLGGGLAGFASGGSMMIGGRGGTDNNLLSINGSPVARVSRGERLDIVPNLTAARSGGGSQGPQVSLSFHNDFRGAAPEAVSHLSARLDRMQRELPGTIVTTMQDARSRFVWRDR